MTVEHRLDINHHKITDRKSPQMMEVEELVGNVGEFLEVSYVFFRMGPGRISEEVRRISQERLLLNSNRIRSWIKQFGIPQRSLKEAIRLSWRDPVIKARRQEAVRRSWQDPEKKQRRLSLIHSEEANRKRSEIRTLWCKDHPEQIREITEKARGMRKQRAVLEMENVLGEEPAQALRRMHWEERLSVKQISEQTKQDSRTVRKWMKDAGVMFRNEQKGIGYVKGQDREIFERAFGAGLTQQLNERGRHILEERFLTEDTHTLEEIGQKYGITKQRVLQIEQGAFRRLGRLLNPQQSMNDVRIILPEELMVRKLNLLGLPNGVRNALAGGIRRGLISFHNPADLKDMPDEKLLKIRNLGPRSVVELKEKLQHLIENST